MILDRKFLKFFEHHHSVLKRYLSAKKNSFTAQCLKERSLLQISGNDANVYLQGLVTNDMKHLQDGVSSMFALFLNSKGRVLYDSLIYKGKNENIYFIECDADGASFLKDHLLKYKVRRKITVESLENDYDVWAVINSDNFNISNYKEIVDIMKQNLKDMVVTIDPRLSCLGLRVLAPKNINICNEVKNKTSLEITEENFYKGLRYKLGIGEGLQELPSEKCFPMEINGDYLHGISFHKGCYIGQELTARTYHTGVIRKRLMPLIFNEELKISESGIPIFTVPQGSKSIGKLQGIEQNTGVGLLRIEEALKADELMVLDKKCKTHRPFWWPTEAPKERMNIG